MGLRTLGLRRIGIQNPVVRRSSVTPPAPDIPVVLSAEIQDAFKQLIYISFDMPMDQSETPDPFDFNVSLGSITNVQWEDSPSVISLTVSTPYDYGDVVTIGYTPGTNPLQGLAGGLIASFSGQVVTNNIVWPAPPSGDLITITTTLTGDFSITWGGVGTAVITWPDASTSSVILTGTQVTTTKTLAGGGTITISNPSVITYFDVAYGGGSDANEITALTGLEYCPLLQTLMISGSFASFTTSALWTALESLEIGDCPNLTSLATHAEWTTLLNFFVYDCPLITSLIRHVEWTVLESSYLANNALNEASVNDIITTSLAAGMSTGYIDLTGGTNAAPTGAGITAADALNAAGVVVTANGYRWVITITTTLTGDFWIYLDGVGTVIITWPDASTSDVVMTGGGAVLTTKTITPGTITISNASIITWLVASSSEITDCLIPDTLIGLQYFSLYNNKLTETSVNGILTSVLASGITSGAIDLTSGTNAAPTGVGITAADSLNAAGVTVMANGYTWP